MADALVVYIVDDDQAVPDSVLALVEVNRSIWSLALDEKDGRWFKKGPDESRPEIRLEPVDVLPRPTNLRTG